MGIIAKNLRPFSIVAAGLVWASFSSNSVRAADVDFSKWPAMTERAQAKINGAQLPIGIYDPVEGVNRRMYVFNSKFDRYVFLPMTEAYETATPDFVQDRVGNFLGNLGEITNFTNSILQGKADSAGTALGRFVTNTTVGLAGTFDVASDAGLEEAPEDFGQTLASYGVPEGAYIVLPVLGPSNARDTGGLIFDSAVFYMIDPLNFENFSAGRYIHGTAKALDTRKNTKFRYHKTGSPFEYELVRFLYTAKRRLETNR